MTKTTIRNAALFVGLAAVCSSGLPTELSGFAIAGPRWGTNAVPYYVNPQNTSVSQAAAIAAIQAAAAGWSDQSQANVEFIYSGQTNGSALTLNNKNEVFFRNTPSPSGYVAETYWWYDGSNRLIDFDIAFYEGGYRFYTGNSGCDAGVYIDDVGIHEFGHALGLEHSAVAGATMAPAMPGYCDRSQTILESDDIAAVESLYPPTVAQTPLAPSQLSAAPTSGSAASSLTLNWVDNATNENGYRIERSTGNSSFSQIGQVNANTRTYVNSGLASGTSYSYRVYAYNDAGTSGFSNVATGQTQAAAPTNTPPSVVIVNPVNNASYPSGASITFTATAADTQDGSLASNLRWMSSIDGTIGSGGSFTRTLSAGTHTITASVTDSGGLSGSARATVVITNPTPTASPSPSLGPTLTVRGYKLKGVPQADLAWSGLSATSVTIRRDGAVVATTANDGTHTDVLERKSSPGGPASATYQVCADTTCTNSVRVTF